MIKLSVAIIAFNEEDKISRCIESVKVVADEIIVIDSCSTDKTSSICQSLGAKVIRQEFLGYIEQKNFALSKTEFDYVLSLDADEVLSEELQNSILSIKKNWNADAYMFNRLTDYGGQWIRHCGWYPDTKLRLVNKNKAEWRGKNPHDKLELKNSGEIKHLKGDLLHYSYDGISDHIKQTNNFTNISSEEAYETGVRVSPFKPLIRGLWQFVRDYFLKLGFLDGRKGLRVCLINSLAYYLKFEKILERQERDKN